jgi:predicted dehydrogenase
MEDDPIADCGLRIADLCGAAAPVRNEIWIARFEEGLTAVRPKAAIAMNYSITNNPRHVLCRATLHLLLLTSGICVHAAGQAPLRAGMIGLDTSHVPAFAKLFNNAKAGSDAASIRIVAGYPGGTDIPASRDRVGKFTEQLRGMGIEIVDTIPKLIDKVDVVLLESVDGRIHLQEATPVIKAGKPLFIDKPVAGSLADAIVIYELAKKHNVPCFSSSSLRFSPGIQELVQNEKVGTIAGAATWGPCSYQEGIPDMFFYGIHGIEPLYVLMGAGCETVTRIQTKDTDLVSGLWKDGRVGTYRGLRRNRADFGAVAFGSKGIVQSDKEGGYEELCREIGRFFKTGKSPVRAEETIEIFAFMEAADESKRQKGAPVSLAGVLAKAKAEAAAKLAQ